MSDAPRRLHPHGTARMLVATEAARPTDWFEALRRGAELHDLSDQELHFAEELVRLCWSLDAEERQTLILLVLASMVATRQGSTRLPLDPGARGPLGRTLASLARAAGLPADAARLCRRACELLAPDRLDRLVGRPGEYRPLLVTDRHLYQHRMLAVERTLVEHCQRLLAAGPPAIAEADTDAALRDLVHAPAHRGTAPVTLTDEQLAAVRAALLQRLTVITGGPGTGKTSVVVSILRCAVRLGIAPARMALAAPTGKAAQRMASAIREALDTIDPPGEPDRLLGAALPEPQTLHRLLGYLPREQRFRHHENAPIAAGLVVVDEASMIDLGLMERLLGALPGDAQLVLLGDADQLPSVEAGAVLRDLVAASDRRSEAGFARRLTRSYRMDPSDPDGRAILLGAAAVNQGRSVAERGGDAVLRVRRHPAELQFRGIELLGDGGRAMEDFLERWYPEQVRGDEQIRRLVQREYRWDGAGFAPRDSADLHALLQHHERTRLLTVTRRGPRGVEQVNRAIHARCLRDSRVELSPSFLPGEPVLMRHNDYQRGLFNGDRGIVVRVRSSETGDGRQRYRVVFPRGDGFALFRIESLRAHLELAYATTVHQSQGSEFECVALLLPESDLPLLSRELVYTAMTRARRSVVLIGDRSVLNAGIRRTIERFSGLADAL